MSKKNIYILGSDSFSLRELESIPHANRYQFHSLIDYKEIIEKDFPVLQMYHDCVQELEGGSVDAIIGYWDFPVTTMLPLLAKKAGILSASFESVLKCEHKYWSRQEQKKCIPEHIPRFFLVDPFSKEESFVEQNLQFPFWLKPVKSASSFLGFRIENKNEFEIALASIRKKITWMAKPFNLLLEMSGSLKEINGIDGYYCIAEDIISSGWQCTQEGYVQGSKVKIYGTIDSLCYPNHHGSCFSRYEYPSRLPQEITLRMSAITEKIMSAIGYDNACFNIEYFWDQDRDKITLLEINPRLSKSHCPLFRMVDGASHLQNAVAVALGNPPNFPCNEGQFTCAAKVMLRHFQNGSIKKSPCPSTINELQSKFPEILIVEHAKTGMLLSELKAQDSYSFKLADVFLGAQSQEQLEEKIACIVNGMHYEIG